MGVLGTMYAAAAAAKSLQSCPTLQPQRQGSPVPGVLQARTLEWVAISFSKAWKWKVKVKSLSHVWLYATPWTAAYQAPPSIGFSRQEYWSGVPLPSLHFIWNREIKNFWNFEVIDTYLKILGDPHCFLLPFNHQYPQQFIFFLRVRRWYVWRCTFSIKKPSCCWKSLSNTRFVTYPSKLTVTVEMLVTYRPTVGHCYRPSTILCLNTV